MDKNLFGGRAGTTLCGTIDAILYTADSGFTVMRLVEENGNEAIAVGTIPELKKGETLDLTGKWTSHPKYGERFQIERCRIKMPTTEEGLITYLGSGMIKYIGPETAKNIVDAFGLRTLEILDNNIGRLVDVHGIGRVRQAQIAEEWQKQKQIRHIMMFLAGLGITPNLATKIQRQYGENTIIIVQQTPYRLAEDIHGVGFLTADKIAMELGLAHDCPERIGSGILYTLGDLATDGHTCYPQKQLVFKAAELLGVKPDLVTAQVEPLKTLGKIIIEEDFIYIAWLYRAEKECARCLLAIADTPSYIVQAVPDRDDELTDEQLEAICLCLQSKIIILTGGPGTGKGLALDTPIPTIHGWKTMGDIQVGDQTFDECGQPCQVIFVSDIHLLPCYQVGFDDGTKIIADNEHLWLTHTRASRKSLGRRRNRSLLPRGTDQSRKQINPSIISTEQIVETLRVGNDNRFNHSIPLAGAVEFVGSSLPLDPYVLGAWLGNGGKHAPVIDDGDVLVGDEITRLGYVTRKYKAREGIDRRSIRTPENESLFPILRNLGILNNKHIPETYLVATVADRWSLLQGLMDTDGHCESRGRCEITFTTYDLAKDTFRLVRSLGIKAYWDERPAKLKGKQCGIAYRVTFMTDKPVFRCSGNTQRLPKRTRKTTEQRYITSVELIQTVPTRCIQVDSPSRLYLASYACIPTHNTHCLGKLLDLCDKHEIEYALCCPTGRAAKRMAEATGREAQTIHRLLGFDPRTGQFNYNEDSPLPVELLVVDETSMLDISLASHLLKAISPLTHLLLVGDVDQLPSVGPGNVLRDIIESQHVPVVRLSLNFRQTEGSFIITNAHRVNQGDYPIFPRGAENDFFFFDEEDPVKAAELIVDLVCQRTPAKFGIPSTDIQVLAPMRRGEVGIEQLNIRLQAALNPPAGQVEFKAGGTTFRVGDRVMQIRNNYDLDVFNGDIGFVNWIDREEKKAEVEIDGRPVVYDFSECDELVLAYAVTIHKSQGSEYPCIVMPLLTQHYMMLQRNLVYTGITRAKKLVIIVGSKKALAMAVRNNKIATRYSRLDNRLRLGELLKGGL